MDRPIKMLLIVFAGTLLIGTAWAAGKTEVYKAAVNTSGVQKIEMVGGDFYFKPNDVIVKVNVPVEIAIKKEPGFASHSIVLHSPKAGIDFDVDLSEDVRVIRFTPRTVGKYPFYCDEGLIEKHRAKGMEGILEVTE